MSVGGRSGLSEQVSNSEVPRPGDVLAGKYEVEGLLGAGGMGVVVAARHIDLAQRVAIKVLNPQFARHTEAATRFFREARAAARIQSEHVARVHDVAKLENGAPYMVMEHLTGTDLDQLVRSRGPLPVEEAVDYVLQACEAIAEAHALGIIHRDLKPANMFLTRRADGSPLVKVLDFGMSKATVGSEGGVPEQSLTATASLLGSPLYMSPEQVRSSKTIDVRSDVWSLGVILHKLVTGAQPFQAETLSSCLAKIIADPPSTLRQSRGDAPAELEAVILRCLEKDLSRRLQNVAEFAWALQPFAPERSRISIERIVKVLMGSDVLTEKTLPLSAAAAAPFLVQPAGAPPSPGGASVDRAAEPAASRQAGEVSAPVMAGSAPLVAPIESSTSGAWKPAPAKDAKGAGKALLLVGGIAVLVAIALVIWRVGLTGRSDGTTAAALTPSVVPEASLPNGDGSATAAPSVQVTPLVSAAAVPTPSVSAIAAPMPRQGHAPADHASKPPAKPKKTITGPIETSL
ncbi:MAG: protein kinase [Byssovorax sp.]